MRDLERRYHTLLALQRRSGGAAQFDEGGYTTPLSQVPPERLIGVLRARVERLEALWARSRRKRETRVKIVGFGAVLAELRDVDDGKAAELKDWLLDVLDRRVDRPRDRASLRELFGFDLTDEPPFLRASIDPAQEDAARPDEASFDPQARLRQARAMIEAEDGAIDRRADRSVSD